MPTTTTTGGGSLSGQSSKPNLCQINGFALYYALFTMFVYNSEICLIGLVSFCSSSDKDLVC